MASATTAPDPRRPLHVEQAENVAVRERVVRNAMAADLLRRKPHPRVRHEVGLTPGR
ncbi:hypothetical protein [[Mycobacterium] crassicus]|uniref:Uncharacterized protein n=1 Tax=[Mycobacterium] crassicus TaxID=2872309 RepID=A0ABU5XDP5_9MYCO|nr:hypothetical protein [Mycolicibacter sp. MYC098]MEB3019923.1 hypothetical protein [Mycolicibacter sp. MYC098]